MGQLKDIFGKLSTKQKVSIGGVLALVVFALYSFVHWRHEQDFKPLYTGVAPEDAAAIVQKIKENGTEYRLSETGGVISVPSQKIPELRLELAAAGLPRTGRIGFELFDKTNFGATEFVEHVNYNRALEGELERSIATLNPVEQARVHLTAAKDSVFLESREPAKASVVVKLRLGAGSLQPQNVTAIQQLVGSAVEGLDPADVSVLDTRGNLLSKRRVNPNDPTEAVFDQRQRIEHDLVEKVNATLEPLLGRDKFRAAVTVDLDSTTAEQNEETFDPSKSVMTSSKKTEEVMTGNSNAGIPGTTSNLPRPPARIGGPSSMTTRRTEDVNYESSHVVRKTHIPNGSVRRMSVSLLLDQHVRWEGKGAARHAVAIPLPAETIKSVHDLVAGVTGFAQERGDQITVESLPFESTLENDPNPELTGGAGGKDKPFTWKDLLKDKKMMMFAGGGALLLILILGALVFLMMRSGSKKKNSGKTVEVAEHEKLTKADLMKAVEEAKAKAALEAAQQTQEMEEALAEQMAEQHKQDMAAIAALKLPASTSKKTELLTKEIRESTKKDPSVSAHVIQTWMHES